MATRRNYKKHSSSKKVRRRKSCNVTRKNIRGGGKLMTEDGKAQVKAADLTDFKTLDKLIVTQNDKPAYQITITDAGKSQESFAKESPTKKPLTWNKNQEYDQRSDQIIKRVPDPKKENFYYYKCCNNDNNNPDCIENKNLQGNNLEPTESDNLLAKFDNPLDYKPVTKEEWLAEYNKFVKKQSYYTPGRDDKQFLDPSDKESLQQANSEVKIYNNSKFGPICKTNNYRDDDPNILSVTWTPKSNTVNKYLSWGKSLFNKNTKSPLQEFKDAISFIYNNTTTSIYDYTWHNPEKTQIPKNYRQEEPINYGLPDKRDMFLCVIKDNGKTIQQRCNPISKFINFNANAIIILTPGSVRIGNDIYIRLYSKPNSTNRYKHPSEEKDYLPLRPNVFKQRVLNYYKTLASSS